MKYLLDKVSSAYNWVKGLVCKALSYIGLCKEEAPVEKKPAKKGRPKKKK